MLALYFILAFALTWAVLIPTVVYIPEESQIPFIIVAAFGPFGAALITIWTHWGWSGVSGWLRGIFTARAPITLYLAGAVLLPALIGVLHYGLYRMLGGEPALATAEPLLLYPIYLILTALLTGGNEEPGWRGFALPALLQRFHPVVAALILGVIHSAWHLPLMSSYDTSFGWYVFNLVPLTVILNWVYLKSRYNVIPVMLLHAATNVIGTFAPTPTDVLGGWGTYMVLRGGIYWAIAIVLIVATRGKLGVPARTWKT
jgi:membrane protease YdiL (CAAX protease family)